MKIGDLVEHKYEDHVGVILADLGMHFTVHWFCGTGVKNVWYKSLRVIKYSKTVIKCP